MVGLLVWKALPRFTTFPRDDVTPEMIDAIKIRAPYTYITMVELLAGLERVGRGDLVRAIRAQVERVSEGRWARQKRKWRHSFAKRLGRLRAPGG
jgi:hypothetical protein